MRPSVWPGNMAVLRQTAGEKAFRYQHLDMLRKCSFHAINRITSSAMRILSPKKYSLAPGILNPERKSPSMPTVEMVSPIKIYAVHEEIFFDRFMHVPGAAGAFTGLAMFPKDQSSPEPLFSFPGLMQARLPEGPIRPGEGGGLWFVSCSTKSPIFLLRCSCGSPCI